MISRRGARSSSLPGPSVRMLSIRVAMAAAGIVGVAYLVIAGVVAVVVTNNMTADLDHRLTDEWIREACPSWTGASTIQEP